MSPEQLTLPSLNRAHQYTRRQRQAPVQNSRRIRREISLDFRRISSNLLSSDDGDADVNLHRLMDYIEKTPFIHDRVHSVVDQVEYDFQACFPTHSSEWASTSIPVDENCSN